MHLSTKAYEWLKRITAKHYRGDGFVVDIIPASAVRYRQNGRTITFAAEPLHVIDQDAKIWILGVYVHRPLIWDGATGESVNDLPAEEMVLARIEMALRAKVGKFEFIRN